MPAAARTVIRSSHPAIGARAIRWCAVSRIHIPRRVRGARNGPAPSGLPEDDVPADLGRSLGSVQMALMSGLVGQALLDPDNAPSGAEIVRGLRELADLLES